MRGQILDEFLTYYYKAGTEPFRTLSTLNDDEFMAVMKDNFPEDRLSHKAPRRRITERRATEQWLRETFIKQGGKPKLDYPFYMVLGTSNYIEQYDGFEGIYHTVQVPLAEFDSTDVSFTYPDSVISKWLADCHHPLYNSAYHGKIFSLSAIRALIANYGITGCEWVEQPERKFDIFIEAQIWNDAPLQSYL
ncbi:MAG: hypothetical protein AAF639_11385 [Chloroflexota bacterium]